MRDRTEISFPEILGMRTIVFTHCLQKATNPVTTIARSVALDSMHTAATLHWTDSWDILHLVGHN